MVVGVDWTSWYGILFAIATGIGAIGGAFVLLTGAWRSIVTWARPSEPLIGFGHPEEVPIPWVVFTDGSEAAEREQERQHEAARLAQLRISYLVENKDATNAVHELSTGIRTRDGSREHTFEDCFVQILGAGEKVDVPNAAVPEELREGMTEANRAENFLYWARFRDARNRRWEATYDPASRGLSYRRLRRS
jgi:hypothetical protein